MKDVTKLFLSLDSKFLAAAVTLSTNDKDVASLILVDVKSQYTTCPIAPRIVQYKHTSPSRSDMNTTFTHVGFSKDSDLFACCTNAYNLGVLVYENGRYANVY